MNIESEVYHGYDGLKVSHDYDGYRFFEDGNIKCTWRKKYPLKPHANPRDINEINKYKDKLIELAKEHEKNSKQTRVDLPGTDLSVLINGYEISLAHNLKSDSEGIFLLDDDADFWIYALGGCDIISVARGRGFIEDISSFLEDVHVAEAEIPELIKENMQEKISVFPTKDKSDPLGEKYKITDYSPKKEKLAEIVKEKLAEIVKNVKNRNKSKEKGEFENEQESRDD